MKLKGRYRFCIVLAIFLVFTALSCKKEGTDQASEPDLSRSSKILKEAGDEYWNRMLEESVYLRLKYGLKIEKIPDVSFEHAQSLSYNARSMLEKLEQIDVKELSHEEWISLEILKWQSKKTVEGLKFFWLNFPVTPSSRMHQVYTTFQFKEKVDLEHYLNLLRQYPVFINDIQNRLQEQFEKGIVLPKDELAIVVPFWSLFIKEGNQSLFFVKDGRLEGFEASEVKDFQLKLQEVIDVEINPALKNIMDFIKGDYSQKASDRVGLWQYPDGLEYYDYLIKINTNMDLTAEEVHETGLKHIKIMYEEVEKIRKSVGFEGTLAEFKHFLQTDPRFFPKTAEEIAENFRSYIKGMDEKVDLYFLKKPKAPYGTERLAPELEASSTWGGYQSPTASNPRGIYYHNGSKPEERSKLEAESLIYHELVPGHHFHGSSQSENEDLPDFRRETHFTAFSEGWAEYAAWLGLEMGLYQDPYSRCGLYLEDIFESARLVVDTGMNHFKWRRSRAVKFMKENTTYSDLQIHSESFRYCRNPGQALGYKLGCMKMFELREKAEKALGEKFDVRKYHDAILGSGAMPLNILEKHLDWFIEKELNSARE
ncbi:MAG TPA: DUF885 domain-containing protein [Candidatus Aminicenantes bacterium]|nr:DUF885 domain-containing protein [Candidatus Aminicenantes bacterium]HEB34948.1 DUF885 domain-containing protein [Candidatus Aminicenantes bacterium]